MAQPITIYRRSELEAVSAGCLYRYKKIWVDQVDDTSDLALVGIGMHKVKYRYILKLIDSGMQADSDLAREAFVEGIAAAMTPSRLIPEMRQLWDWHSEHFELQIDSFVTAEERQESGMVSWSPDQVHAHTDRNELEIIDDKWGWAPPLTEDDLFNLFQARVYAYYAMQRWPNFAAYRFTISACRFNKFVSVVFKYQDLDNVGREMAAHIATIERAETEDHWPAVAGPACRFCELQCPLVDEPVIVPKRFLEHAQATQVAGWILAGEQVIRNAKKALKGYVAGHGPVSVNGVVWDNRPITSKSYPVAAVVKALERINAVGGLDPMESGPSLTISHSALAKLFKQFPKLEQELAPLASAKDSYRFSAKKAGEEEEADAE